MIVLTNGDPLANCLYSDFLANRTQIQASGLIDSLHTGRQESGDFFGG